MVLFGKTGGGSFSESLGRWQDLQELQKEVLEGQMALGSVFARDSLDDHDHPTQLAG